MEGFLSLCVLTEKKKLKQMLGQHIKTTLALPDRYVLAKLGNQPQRGIQLFIFIVGHV